MTTDTRSPSARAQRFAPLPTDRQRWSRFGKWGDRPSFPRLVGLEIEEVRVDYARMRLPYRPEVTQLQGLVHGGAIATLVDTVVVPAVGSAYDEPRGFFTVDMHVSYLSAVQDEDMVAEGWVTRRGGSIVFCQAEVATPSGRLVATASLVYKVSRPSSERTG